MANIKRDDDKHDVPRIDEVNKSNKGGILREGSTVVYLSVMLAATALLTRERSRTVEPPSSG